MYTKQQTMIALEWRSRIVKKKKKVKSFDSDYDSLRWELAIKQAI